MVELIELLSSYNSNVDDWRRIKKIYITYNHKYLFNFFIKFMYRKYFLVIEYHDLEIEKFEISFSEKKKIKNKVVILNQFIEKFNYLVFLFYMKIFIL